MFQPLDLPVLGLGVSLSLGEKPSPLSLYENMQHSPQPQFVEYAGLCDVNLLQSQLQPLQDAKIPLLFHPSFINFCGSLKNHSEWLNTAQEHMQAIQSPWFAQDCAYCFFSDNQGYSSQFAYFIPPILNSASLAQSVMRIHEVKAHIQAPVLIEPPPVTFVIGRMSVFDYFSQLSIEADCGLLLDMGHLVSYQLATGTSVLDDLHLLPVERVIELHIAGGRLINSDNPVYVDAHEEDVLDETWQMFDALLPHLPNIKAVCFECEGVAEEKVFSTLAIIKEKILTLSVNPELVDKVSFSGKAS